MGSAKEVPSPSLERSTARSFSSDADLELRFDRAIETLLIALIAFVPWPFGSVHAWAQEVVIAGSALVAGCFAAKLLVLRRTRLVRSWTYLPVALFVSIALFQLLPLPHAVLRVISPNTLQIKSRLLADLPAAANAAMPLTFYANATHNNLRLLLAVVVIFFVAVNTLRTRGRLKRMLIAISAVGGLVILLALAQDLSGAQKIYWSFAKPIPVAVGGPFIGHNDFPLFANLTIGAAIALLMVMRAERRSSRARNQRMSAERIVALCALFAVIGLGVCTVFLSLSRSGVLALGAASVCIAIVAAIRWRLGLERWMMAVCLLSCLAVSFYFASDSINRRLATLQHPLEQYISRWQINKDILTAWPTFPLFGTGLGTHEFVYPMFEHLLDTANFDHAENEFAQMLEETGALGLGFVLLFVGLMTAAFFKAVKKSTHASIGAATFGLGLGLLAVTFQSGFGFGAHDLSNAALMSIECAMLLNVQRLLQHEDAPRAQVSGALDAGNAPVRALSLSLKLAGSIAVLAAFVPALLGVDRARRGQAAWEPAHQLLLDPNRSLRTLTDDQYQDMILSAQSAHQAEPDNIQYFYWQVDFGWEALEHKHDPNADDDVRPDAEKAELARSVEQLDRIRKLCPTYGPAVLLAGQLRYLVLDQPQGLGLIHLASTVAPTNPNVFLQIAAIDCDRSSFGSAMDAFRRYLSLQGMQRGDFGAVVRFLVDDAKRPDLAMELAADDPERQLMIVSALRGFPGRPDFQTMATQIETKAKVARRAELVSKCSQEDVSGSDLVALAEIYQSEHDLNRSIDCYQRALVKEYGQLDWHLNLAKVLLAAGRASDAEEEASICLRRQPHMAAAEQLISEAEARTARTDKP